MHCSRWQFAVLSKLLHKHQRRALVMWRAEVRERFSVGVACLRVHAKRHRTALGAAMRAWRDMFRVSSALSHAVCCMHRKFARAELGHAFAAWRLRRSERARAHRFVVGPLFEHAFCSVRLSRLAWVCVCFQHAARSVWRQSCWGMCGQRGMHDRTYMSQMTHAHLCEHSDAYTLFA